MKVFTCGEEISKFTVEREKLLLIILSMTKSVDLLCKSTDWFLYGGNIGC